MTVVKHTAVINTKVNMFCFPREGKKRWPGLHLWTPSQWLRLMPAQSSELTHNGPSTKAKSWSKYMTRDLKHNILSYWPSEAPCIEPRWQGETVCSVGCRNIAPRWSVVRYQFWKVRIATVIEGSATSPFLKCSTEQGFGNILANGLNTNYNYKETFQLLTWHSYSESTRTVRGLHNPRYP